MRIKEDIEAFENLYHELSIKAKKLLPPLIRDEKDPSSFDSFHYEFTEPDSPIRRHIASLRRNIDTIKQDNFDYGIDILVSMESQLNKLAFHHADFHERIKQSNKELSDYQ